MPFTPSHAVVALPFVRTPLAPGAIAVGAMTPDLPLFARAVVPSYATTHDVAALPVTVLIALGLLLVWRCVLRPAARELSPQPLARRLPADWDGDVVAGFRETFAGAARRRPSVATVLLLLCSLALGVLSHIAWDLFTHEGRWGTEIVPALAQTWGPFEGYRWLQHASSLVGLVILAVAGIIWWRGRLPAPRTARLLPAAVRIAWWMSLPAALALAWGIGLGVSGPFDAEFTPAHLGYRVLPPACAAWGAVTLLLSAAVQALRARVPHETA